MTIDFTDPDDLVETVHNDYDEDPSLSEAIADDDPSEAGTENSVSDYEGNIQEAPVKMLFGSKECRAIFGQSTDQGAFVRVCGNKEGTCKRGHVAMEKAQEGYYDTVAARKFVDGKLHTFQSTEDHRIKFKQWSSRRDQRLAESVELLASLDDDSDKMVFAKTQRSTPKSLVMAESSKSDEKEMAPFFAPRSSLKKAPAFSEPPEKTILPKDQSSPHHPVLGSVEFMVGTLTDTLKDLKNEMRGIKEQVARVEDRPSSQTRPTSSGTTAATTSSGAEPSDWWYAVGKGKHGASGVFSSWAEASSLVVGISGAIAKKFRDYQQAVEFVKACQVASKPKPKDPFFAIGEGPPDGSSNWTYKSARGGPEQPVLFHQHGSDTTDPYVSTSALEESPVKERFWYAVVNGRHGVWNIFKTWEEASEFVLGYPGALVEKFKTRGEAMAFLDRHKIRLDGKEVVSPSTEVLLDDGAPKPKVTGEPDYLPPMVLIGPDPSAKKSDEVFGVDLGSEMDLRASLLPPNLPDGVSKGLANAMVDVIAIPGGFCGVSNEADGNEMALLGEAMEELVNQGRSNTEGAAKADLHWRSGKRTSLRQISGMDSLRKRIKVLLKMRDKVIKHTIIAVRNACKRAGWEDSARIEAWAHGGYLTRITRDALDYNLSLHQHLMGLLSSGAPWDYVKMEQDHHVEELDLIRTTQDSRLQALCSLYAYLRDGQNKNWHSDELQYKRNMDIFARTTGESGSLGTPRDDLSSSGVPSGHCEKCGTNLHSGGKEACPWNTMSTASAKKNANKFMRAMASGSSVTLAPGTAPP